MTDPEKQVSGPRRVLFEEEPASRKLKKINRKLEFQAERCCKLYATTR